MVAHCVVERADKHVGGQRVNSFGSHSLPFSGVWSLAVIGRRDQSSGRCVCAGDSMEKATTTTWHCRMGSFLNTLSSQPGKYSVFPDMFSSIWLSPQYDISLEGRNLAIIEEVTSLVR